MDRESGRIILMEIREKVNRQANQINAAHIVIFLMQIVIILLLLVR